MSIPSTGGDAVRGLSVLRRDAAAGDVAEQLGCPGFAAGGRCVPQRDAGCVHGGDAQRVPQHRRRRDPQADLHRTRKPIRAGRADRGVLGFAAALGLLGVGRRTTSGSPRITSCPSGKYVGRPQPGRPTEHLGSTVEPWRCGRAGTVIRTAGQRSVEWMPSPRLSSTDVALTLVRSW